MMPIQAMRLRASTSGGGNPVPSGTKVFHLHMDGSNGSSTFTDQTGKTWTALGGAVLSTTNAQFGTACGLFDGTAGISTPYDSSLLLGMGTWMLDFWVRPDSGGSDQDLLAHREASDNSNFWFLRRTSADVLRFLVKYGGTTMADISTVGSVSTSTYTHVRVVATSQHIDGIAFNGVFQSLSGTNGSSGSPGMPTPTVKFWIGCGDDSVAGGLNGRHDEMLLVMGGTYSTSNFTPPTVPWG